jgi:hypothetical protein
VSQLEVIRPRKQSLWDRFRSYTLGPHNLKDKELAKFYMTGNGTSTGVAVSEHTALIDQLCGELAERDATIAALTEQLTAPAGPKGGKK